MARTFSGQLLRDARRAAKLRPEHLAVAVGRTVSTVQAYETGRAQPPVDVLARFAEMLALSGVDAFLADSEGGERVAG